MELPTTTCPDCGRQHQRRACPFCIREEKWNKRPVEKHFPDLSPRIRDIMQHPYQTEHPVVANKGYFCYGPANTGKTVFALKALYETQKNSAIQNIGSKYMVTTLVDLFQNIFKSGYDKYNLIDQYKNADYLVIDDIGLEMNTEFSFSTLYSIVDYRYNWYKPTVYTSNLSLAELAERWADNRITRRILATCEVLKFQTVYYGD